jgi:hypothetical protein
MGCCSTCLVFTDSSAGCAGVGWCVRCVTYAQVDKQDVITASVSSIDMHLNMLRGAINNFGGSVGG